MKNYRLSLSQQQTIQKMDYTLNAENVTETQDKKEVNLEGKELADLHLI